MLIIPSSTNDNEVFTPTSSLKCMWSSLVIVESLLIPVIPGVLKCVWPTMTVMLKRKGQAERDQTSKTPMAE